MKAALSLLILLSIYGCVWGQEGKIISAVSAVPPIYQRAPADNYRISETFAAEDPPHSQKNAAPALPELKAEETLPAKIENLHWLSGKQNLSKESEPRDIFPEGKSPQDKKEEFRWKGAINQSLLFLAIQHGFRMTEDKTRRELGGPFFRDWKESVQNLRGWDDGNKFFTNYIAHPMQGAVTGRIFINNSDRAKRQEFGFSKQYWKSRFKAMIWSAVWSTQFEIGPISEASLGNVGQKPDSSGRSKMTWMDIVLTPTLGTGFAIGEDIIDKYVLDNWIERKIQNKIIVKLLRCVLTPTTTFANLLRAKEPWKRDQRPY